MKHLCLQMQLSSSEEMEEPWPKKLKIDRSYMRSEEPNKLLESLCGVDKKPSSKHLSFPVISWSFSQRIDKLQANDNINLTTNLRQDTLLQPHENVNLQSIVVRNVSFTETWTFASKDSRTITGGSSSEFNKSHNSLVTKPDSWVLPAKEREKSAQSGNISKENELPALSAVFYDVLPGNLIAKIESLPTDGPEFISNAYGTGYHQVYEMLRSSEQHVPKPFLYDENNNSQIQFRSSPSSSFMKGGKSNPKSLVYEYKSVMDMNINVFSYKKQTSENYYFKRNKALQHMYNKPYSRNLKVINPKLVKCAALGLFLQDMGIYNDRTSTEKKGPTIFSHIIVQRKIANDNYTKESVIFSKDPRKDCIFSVAANEEQITNLIHSNNPVLPDNNFPSSMLLKESLCNLKLMYSLTENFQKFECLASFPTFFEKTSCKHTGIQTVVMAACMQKEKGNVFQENNILKQYNQHETGIFRNIHFKNQRKYFQNYTGICKKPFMNKNRFNSKDGQGTFCGVVDKQAHFSCSDTFQKICLSAEEAEEIYFVDNIMFHAEKNKEYSKIHTAIDKQILDSGSCPSNHSCASFKQNLLEQGFKGERSHCPKDLSWYLQNEISYMTFLTNNLNSGNIFNVFSKVHQYFASVTSHELIDQSIVSVNRWHSKSVIHIKREKLNNSSGRQAEKAENENFQEDILFSNKHNSDDIPVKQNVEYVDMKENAVIVLSHIRQVNHSRNLTIPYFKDKSTILSSKMKQQHDVTEENFSLNSELVNKKYEFEMKNHFNMVLKELQMFHEISKENENSFACGQRGEINKENGNTLPCLERHIIEEDPIVPSHCEILDEDPKIFCENKANASFSIMDITMTTVQQNKIEHCSLKDTVLTMPGEQEVPHEFSVSSTSDEELFYSPSEEHCSSWCKQPLSWKPAFVPHSYTEERNFSLEPERGKCFLDGVIKVQPLKTCHRPLRVGLSRRAKPRQLHPYLK